MSNELIRLHFSALARRWPKGTHLSLVLWDRHKKEFFSLNPRTIRDEAKKTVSWFNNHPTQIAKVILLGVERGQSEFKGSQYLGSIQPTSESSGYRHYVLVEVRHSEIFIGLGRSKHPLALSSQETLSKQLGFHEAEVWWQIFNTQLSALKKNVA